MESLETRRMLSADLAPVFSRSAGLMIWSLNVPADKAAEIRRDPLYASTWFNNLKEQLPTESWTYQLVETRVRPVPTDMLQLVMEDESPADPPDRDDTPQDLPQDMGVLVSGSLTPADSKDVFRVFLDPAAIGVRVDLVPKGSPPPGVASRVTLSIPAGPSSGAFATAPQVLTVSSAVISWRPTAASPTEIMLTVEKARTVAPSLPNDLQPKPDLPPQTPPASSQTNQTTSPDHAPQTDPSLADDPPGRGGELDLPSSEPDSESLLPSSSNAPPAHAAAIVDYILEYELVITQFLPIVLPPETPSIPIVSTPSTRADTSFSSGGGIPRSNSTREVVSLTLDVGRIASSSPGGRSGLLVRSDQMTDRSSLPTSPGPGPVAQPLLHQGRERAVVDLSLLEGEITTLPPGNQNSPRQPDASQKMDPGSPQSQPITRQISRDRSASRLPLLPAELPRIGFRSIRAQVDPDQTPLEQDLPEDLIPNQTSTASLDDLQTDLPRSALPLPSKLPRNLLAAPSSPSPAFNWPLTLGASVASMLALGLLWPELASLRWGNRRRHVRRGRSASGTQRQGLLSWLRGLSSRNSAAPRLPG
jgi:hypothetical protein